MKIPLGQQRFVSTVTWNEVLAWVTLVAVLWTVSGYVNWLEFELRKIKISPFVVAVNEASSGFSALVLVLFVRAWLNRFPLTIQNILTSLPAHLLGSLIFSVSHVGIMIGIRTMVYGAMGWAYRPAMPAGDFGFLKMLAYEYGKDLPVYGVFVLIIFLYRLYRFRQLDEKSASLDVGEETKARKIRVKEGDGDVLLDIDQIDWFQAASNYVQVYSGGKEYLIRGALSELEKKLDEVAFLRVHRSYIVNLKKVEKIVAAEGGGKRLEMQGGAVVPVGRKYKEDLDRIIAN